MKLYNILMPEPSKFDRQVLIDLANAIIDRAGGYTQLPYTVEGWYKRQDGELDYDKSTVIQVAGSIETVTDVARMIKDTLQQESVMLYEVSPNVVFV